MKTWIMVPLAVCLWVETARAADAFATRVSWLVDTARSVAVSARRDRFVTLLDAVIEPSQQQQLLAHRIDVKYAHSKLLQTAQFSRDPDRAGWAQARSMLFLEGCLSMLLDS